MSFAIKIKNEIMLQDYSKNQIIDLINGVIFSSEKVAENKTIIKINNKIILNFLLDKFKELNLSYEKFEQHKNWVIVDYQINGIKKLSSAFYSGSFLVGGSISKPTSTSYHMEIKFFHESSALSIIQLSAKLNLFFSIIKRRGSWILYLKKSDLISDFLKAICTFDSLLEFEDERIKRDFKNNLNRYSNLDINNQKKLASASQEFLDLLDFVTSRKLLSKFQKNELIFFKIKRKNIYSSLEELAEIFNRETKLERTKSGMNHYLIKLRRIVKEEKQKGNL